MKKEEKKSSGIPLVIIILVLVLVVVGGWWFYNSSKPSPNANRAANATNAARANQANAPIGAQPPNMLGSPTATVTVEEFADFQCPTCATVHPALKQVQSRYGSKIKFIFRNFPLSMHDKAYSAAVAAEAAGMQGRFWDMQNQLFQNQQAWSSNPNYMQLFTTYAENIGLNVEQFRNDMAGMQAKSRVDADLQRARGLNVNSTPTVYVNGKQAPSVTVDILSQMIDAELQSAAAQPAGNTAAANSAPAIAAPANTK